jgi:transcriptional regulator with XRE-family HTH domain
MSWPLASDIAGRIRRIREALGAPGEPLSQSELARRAGVRASQVSQWERGAQRPSRSRLERWADREGWPIAVFQEGGPLPSPALRDDAGAESPRPVDGATVPRDLDELLARFYHLMADAAARGQPVPAELARLMDGMYRAAITSRSKVPDW